METLCFTPQGKVFKVYVYTPFLTVIGWLNYKYKLLEPPGMHIMVSPMDRQGTSWSKVSIEVTGSLNYSASDVGGETLSIDNHVTTVWLLNQLKQ